MAENGDRKLVSDLNSITRSIVSFACTVVVSIMIFINILNILVFARPKLRRSKMAYYNIILSAVNIIALVLGALYYFPRSNGEYFYLKYNLSCLLLSFSLFTIVQMSSWLNVMLAFDRMLCVTSSKHFKWFRNKKKLYRIVIGLFVLLGILNSPNLWWRVEKHLMYDAASNETVSIMMCTSTSSLILTRNTIEILMRIVFPITLEIILSSILVYKLIQIRQRVITSRSLKYEYRFSFMIIMVIMSNLFTQFPLILVTIYFGLKGRTPVNPHDLFTTKEIAISLLVFVCCTTFSMYMFVSIIVVNATINKLFQNEVRRIICGIKKKHTISQFSRSKSNIESTMV